MVQSLYSGTITDAHFHLWRYSPERYPWLAGEGLAPLRKDHLPDDYARLARKHGITASVHVEANWRDDDPVAETRWLSNLDLPPGVGDSFVVHVPLSRPDAPAILEQQLAFPRVVGVRDIIAWHPDPAKSRVPSERMDDPLWQENFTLLAGAGLMFDLMVTPFQADRARRLMESYPDTTFALNHCCGPIEQDAEGMTHWADALHILAGAPNAVIKISDPVTYGPPWTHEGLRRVILACLDCFGPERAMFASDHPVLELAIGFGEWLELFKQTVADFSQDEQRAIFSETAARTYRIKGGASSS